VTWNKKGLKAESKKIRKHGKFFHHLQVDIKCFMDRLHHLSEHDELLKTSWIFKKSWNLPTTLLVKIYLQITERCWNEGWTSMD
jgi:hypothetical protein